jgi:hypothetical protein
MIEVTKERFYSSIAHLNVHPRPEPLITIWEIQGTREMVGKSVPGYMFPGDKHVYNLEQRFVQKEE